MNEKNLIPFTKRTPREHSKLSKMGAKKSNEVQKKKKEEAKQNEKLVDILKKVIFSEVKSEIVKKKIKELGIEGSNYFTALCAVSTTKAMQKGDFAEGLIYSRFTNDKSKYIIEKFPIHELQSIHIGIDYGASKSRTAFVAIGFTRSY